MEGWNGQPVRMEMSEIIRLGGGMPKLAKTLGLHRASLWYWTRVPPQHVKAVSVATGVPPHKLRPDLWDAPADAKPEPSPQPRSRTKRSNAAITATSEAEQPQRTKAA